MRIAREVWPGSAYSRMRRLLIRNVWPNPKLEDVELLRPLDCGTVIVQGRGWEATLRCNSNVSVWYRGTRIWESANFTGPNNTWPALPEVRPSWRAASMLSALRDAEKELPQDPVGYKALRLNERVGAGVLDPDGFYTWPKRIMSPAKCLVKLSTTTCSLPPGLKCTCGFHAARSVVELSLHYAAGVLVVTPIGRTVWHDNAWRAAGYQVHAAVVPLDWPVPDEWDHEVPIVRARTPLIPYRAYQVAREVRAMVTLELEEVVQ